MSEVEFRYTSTGSSDILYLDGPVIEVTITAPLPLVSFLADNDYAPYPIVSGMALIDTGAALSVVDESVMQELNIPIVQTLPIQTVHGIAELNRYNASMSLPGLAIREVPLTLAPAGLIRSHTHTGVDVIMLLGRDFLRQMVITYDGPNSCITVRT